MEITEYRIAVGVPVRALVKYRGHAHIDPLVSKDRQVVDLGFIFFRLVNHRLAEIGIAQVHANLLSS